ADCSWERHDREHAAENFFQGGSQKQATPLTAPATSLTTKNRFTPNFRGWGLDENLKPKSPPYRGSHLARSSNLARIAGCAPSLTRRVDRFEHYATLRKLTVQERHIA